MDLLQNAVESIKVGVEDYENGDHARLLAAVRNIHAGILLLYKEALRRLSPDGSNEVLVKAKMLPRRDANGNVYLVGDGAKTVDVQQIKERFAGLGISTDWKKFDGITCARNEIEHYYTKATQKSLQGLIADAFVLTRDFIATQLDEDPLLLLGDTTWQAMLEVEGVHQVERAKCEEALRAFPWESAAVRAGVMGLTCDECGSDLLHPRSEAFHYWSSLDCRACGNLITTHSYIPAAIVIALGADRYSSFTDGGDSPYVDCPICGKESYIIEEECCALCGESVSHTCSRCANSIPPEELGTSVCGYCEHMTSKDD